MAVSEDAVAALAAADPVMADLARRVRPISVTPPAEGPPDLLGALLRQIAGQQISTVAAAAILGRLRERFGGGGTPAPAALAAAGEEGLRAVGLSRAKAASVQDLASRVADGRLDLTALPTLGDDAVRDALTAVRGIGRWSADLVLLRELGRPDVLPSGDLGIRKAVQAVYGLPALPTAREVDALGERWRPHRSTATRLLYASLRP